MLIGFEDYTWNYLSLLCDWLIVILLTLNVWMRVLVTFIHILEKQENIYFWSWLIVKLLDFKMTNIKQKKLVANH